jgi:hypothetical protein
MSSTTINMKILYTVTETFENMYTFENIYTYIRMYMADDNDQKSMKILYK